MIRMNEQEKAPQLRSGAPIPYLMQNTSSALNLATSSHPSPTFLGNSGNACTQRVGDGHVADGRCGRTAHAPVAHAFWRVSCGLHMRDVIGGLTRYRVWERGVFDLRLTTGRWGGGFSPLSCRRGKLVRWNVAFGRSMPLGLFLG